MKCNVISYLLFSHIIVLSLSRPLFTQETIFEGEGKISQKKNASKDEELDNDFDEIEQMLKESKKIRGAIQLQSGVASNEQPNQTSQNSFSNFIDRISFPNIFVVVDLVGDFSLRDAETSVDDNYFIRETEFGFSGNVDYLLTGQVNIAIHNEEGSFFAELHEAYFELPTLPWNLFLKVGNFFFDAGRLNRRHRHDWDFTIAPIVHERLFDEEAVHDTGTELSYLTPLPFYQEIKFGVFNGRTFGHADDNGSKKPHPLYLGRIKNFFELPFHVGILWGFTFLRYSVTQPFEGADYTYGSDLTFRWRRSNLHNLTWSSEFWYRVKQRSWESSPDNTGISEKMLGIYSYIEYGLYSTWFWGIMFEYYAESNSFSINPESHFNLQIFSQRIWFTWRPSEFSYFRLSFQRNDVSNQVDNYILRIQSTFLIGFHPGHAF